MILERCSCTSMSDMSKSVIKGLEWAIAFFRGCSTRNLGGHLCSVGGLGVTGNPVDPFSELGATQKCGGAEARRRLGLGVPTCQLVHVVVPNLRSRGVPRQVTWPGGCGRLAAGQVDVPGEGRVRWVRKHRRGVCEK